MKPRLKKYLIINETKIWFFEMINNIEKSLPRLFNKNRERVPSIKSENKKKSGISLVVQWIRLQAPNAGGPGSIPGQGTRFHMPRLKPGAVK